MEQYLYQDLNNLETKHWWHISKRKTCQSLILFTKKESRKKILDIGCGTGQNIKDLMQFGEVWGLDISKEAISFCLSKGIKNVKLGDCYQIPFPDESFDVITLLDVLEHTDESKTLKEIHRVLKKNGSLIITVPAFSWLWSKWDTVLHHKRRYTETELNFQLKLHHFKILKISYLYSFLVLPALILRFIKSTLYKNHYPSDFKISPPLINNIALFMADMERSIMLKYKIPFGTSVVCLAQKI